MSEICSQCFKSEDRIIRIVTDEGGSEFVCELCVNKEIGKLNKENEKQRKALEIVIEIMVNEAKENYRSGKETKFTDKLEKALKELEGEG